MKPRFQLYCHLCPPAPLDALPVLAGGEAALHRVEGGAASPHQEQGASVGHYHLGQSTVGRREETILCPLLRRGHGYLGAHGQLGQHGHGQQHGGESELLRGDTSGDTVVTTVVTTVVMLTTVVMVTPCHSYSP